MFHRLWMMMSACFLRFFSFFLVRIAKATTNTFQLEHKANIALPSMSYPQYIRVSCITCNQLRNHSQIKHFSGMLKEWKNHTYNKRVCKRLMLLYTHTQQLNKIRDAFFPFPRHILIRLNDWILCLEWKRAMLCNTEATLCRHDRFSCVWKRGAFLKFTVLSFAYEILT